MPRIKFFNERTGRWECADISTGGNNITDDKIAGIVKDYLEQNPPQGFEIGENLDLQNGILSVKTTNEMMHDNTLPITSAGVFATVGNIEALLKTI